MPHTQPDTAASMPTTDPLGTVHVTKHVLASIIELSALQIEGVAKLAPVSSPWARLPFRAEPQRGMALNVHGNTVAADLYLILQPGVNMPQVGRAVQDAVAAAIEDMLGMTAGEINVFIQDVA